MFIRRSKRNHGFTVLDNATIRDPDLSWKATGMLCFLLSFPDDWQINTRHLVNSKADGQASVQSAINELKEKGYLRKTRVVDDSGKVLRWETTVFEHPDLGNPDLGNPDLGNPDLGNPDLGNPVTGNRGHILNTERQITELTNHCRDQEATADFEKQGSQPPQSFPVQSNPTPATPQQNIPAETHGTKPKLPPRHPGLAPNPDSYTPPVPLTPPANWRKPWEADAPWASPEERQSFEAFIARTLKEKGKYSSDLLGFIMSRTARGEDMGTWIAYRASTGGTEANQPTTGVPEEWTRLLDECVALSFAANPIIARLEGLNMFRVKYTYSSTGQETKLGPDADKWAVAEKKRLEQELKEKRGAA